jgi:hypothetical protein
MKLRGGWWLVNGGWLWCAWRHIFLQQYFYMKSLLEKCRRSRRNNQSPATSH